MKQNSCAIVDEVTKPTGIRLDELDCAIESFSAGVVDSVFAVIEQPLQMPSKHLDHFLDRLQPTAHGIACPIIEESPGCSRIAIDPELNEGFFDAPSSAGLEVELVQVPERDRLSTAPIGISLEPRPFASRQRRAARLQQATMLLFTHSIDRFPKVFGDMESVMDDASLMNAGVCRTNN